MTSKTSSQGYSLLNSYIVSIVENKIDYLIQLHNSNKAHENLFFNIQKYYMLMSPIFSKATEDDTITREEAYNMSINANYFLELVYTYEKALNPSINKKECHVMKEKILFMSIYDHVHTVELIESFITNINPYYVDKIEPIVLECAGKMQNGQNVINQLSKSNKILTETQLEVLYGLAKCNIHLAKALHNIDTYCIGQGGGVGCLDDMLF